MMMMYYMTDFFKEQVCYRSCYKILHIFIFNMALLGGSK
jgi:hypothetical protein